MRSNEKFTQRAEYAIEKAGAAAGNMGHSYVGTEHLLLGILLEGIRQSGRAGAAPPRDNRKRAAEGHHVA